MYRALFINLDDTLITTISGRLYGLHSEDWKLTNGIVELIKKFHNNNYDIVILSNQNQIEDGIIKKEIFDYKINTICRKIEREVKKGLRVKVHYSYKRKSFEQMPNPGLIYDAAMEHELFIAASLFVGCKEDHSKASKLAGIGRYIDINEIYTII